MSPLVYWLLFAAACVLVLTVPAVAWLERRADSRDAELWEQRPGAVRRESDPLREQAEGLARAMFAPAIDWPAAKDAMVLATIGEPDDHRGEA